jgi:pimeloyl-ACP methyl ester carboxylesterase
MTITKHNFILPSQNEFLSGTINYCSKRLPPKILFLYGGGEKINRHNVCILDDLSSHNISSLCFDYSGQGESTGQFSDSSIQKRVTEAYQMLSLLPYNDIYIISVSMGAHIACELLQLDSRIKGLILFCPAAYPNQLRHTKFSHSFSHILSSTHLHSMHSSVFFNLNLFEGKVLFVLAEHDSVIPKIVIDNYLQTIKNGSTVTKVIPGSTHNYLYTRWKEISDYRNIFDTLTWCFK